MDGIADILKPVSPLEALQKYTINLTNNAKDGRVDPVVGREVEIRRVMEILSRRTKNNSILIGDPDFNRLCGKIKLEYNDFMTASIKIVDKLSDEQVEQLTDILREFVEEEEGIGI